jgi:hypothetical protein
MPFFDKKIQIDEKMKLHKGRGGLHHPSLLMALASELGKTLPCQVISGVVKNSFCMFDFLL